MAPTGFARGESVDVTARGFAVFETALGWCGIAWSANGVTGVRLPDGSVELTRARLRAENPGAEPSDTAEAKPPDYVRAAIDEIVALLRGEARPLTGIPLDFSGVPEFHRRVYEVARTIPPGKTWTYGEVAAALGAPGSAQAVGRALGHNPFPIVVPCHRVLGAGGKMIGFSAPGGTDTKRKMLAIERAHSDEPTLF